MEILTALARARRGFRDELRLHVVAVVSLTVAFLCLGGALLTVTNLAHMAERWGHSQHLTVYLAPVAKDAEVSQLRLVLESLGEVERVDHVSAVQAKQEFLSHSELAAHLGALPPDAFPASLEVTLRQGASASRVAQVAERVRQFAGVEDVETYREWFAQLAGLLRAGRSLVAVLSVLVVLGVFAIIGITIRLALANRRREIEVLKLCGATDAFVRAPFLLEGVMQGAGAAAVAMVLLLCAHLSLRGHLDSTLMGITGIPITFLHPLALVGIVLGGGLAGGIGSALSLRRYLAV